MDAENSFSFQRRASESPAKVDLIAAKAAAYDSPRTEDSWSLKAFGSASRIPKPKPAPLTPIDQGIKAKSLFSTPLPTPSQAGLREEALLKIEADLTVRIDSERGLLAAAKAGSAEAKAHEARIEELSSKISRTRDTYERLVAANEEYAKSAKKVQAAERKLQDHKSAEKAGGKSSKNHAALKNVKDELRVATELMAAASSRVEQMERVCDMLIERVQELEKEEGTLRHELTMLSQEKDAQLAEAVERAKQGTPQGNDAKKRLPELTSQLRVAELALEAERTASASARADLDRLAADHAELKQQMTDQYALLLADKERALAEKDASLDSLVRATAAATKEAAKLNEQQEVAKAQLAVVQKQAQQLEGELATLQAEHQAACKAKADLLQEKAQLEKRLTIEANIRTQLKGDVVAKEAAAAALQAELATLTSRFESDLSHARTEAAAAEKRCTELQQEHDQLTAAKAALEEQLAQREAAAAEAGSTLAAMQEDITRLDALNVELRAAMDAKVVELNSEINTLADERALLEREADAMHRDMEEMARQLQVKEEEFKAHVMAGTSRGEGAKIVARLAFNKIRIMQQHVAEYRQAVEAKSAAMASLEHTIAGLQEAHQQRAAVQEAESRVAKAEADAQAMKAELEAQLQEVSTRCNTLEADSAAAAVRLAALEAELQRDKDDAEGRARELSQQIDSLQGQLAAATAERTSLEQQLTAAGKVAAKLSSDVATKSQQLEALHAEMSVARAESESKAQEALDTLHQLAEERNSIVREKDAAVRQLVDLQNQVEVLRCEVQEARAMGTPHGEAAKKVSRLALEKIRKLELEDQEQREAFETQAREAEKQRAEMQATVESLQQSLADKSAELERVQGLLEKAASDAESTQQRLQAQVAELEVGLAESQAAKAAIEERAAGLGQSLQELKDSSAAKLAELEGTVKSLTAELEAATTAKEASTRELAAVNMRLEIVIQEAAAKAESLQAQVGALEAEKAKAFEARTEAEARLADVCNELETAKHTGTPKGEAAKEVSKLALQRIRELQSSVEDARLDLSAKQQHITQLEEQVASLQEASSTAQELESSNRSLQTKCEELAQKVESYRDSDTQLQDQIISLTDQRKTLHSDVVNLSGEVESLQTQLGIARAEANHANKALEEVKGEAMELHGVLAAVKAQRCELQQAKTALEGQVAELNSAAEELRASLDATSAQLEAVKAEYAAFQASTAEEAGCLKQQLAAAEAECGQLKQSLAQAQDQGTPQGNAAKEVSRLAFEKIRGLQQELEEKINEIKGLEAQQEAQQDIATQLSAEVEEYKSALSKEKDSSAARVAEAQAFRQQLESELTSTQQQLQAAKADLEAAQAEAAAQHQRADALALDVDASSKEDLAAKSSLVQKLEAQVAQLGASLAAAGDEVRAAQARVITLEGELKAVEQAAQAEKARLTTQIEELSQEVDSLRDTVSHLGDSLANALAGTSGDAQEEDAEWLELVSEARTERDSMAAAKAAAERRAAELESKLSAAMANLEQAKVQGTPGGAAAKQVARLSMFKLRDLQQQVAHAEDRASITEKRCDELTSDLEAARQQLAAVQAQAKAKAGEASSLADSMHQQKADVQRLQSQVETEQAQVKALEAALAEARSEAAALAQERSAAAATAEREGAATMTSLQDQIMQLQAELSAACLERDAAQNEAVKALVQLQQACAVQEAVQRREQELAGIQEELSEQISKLSLDLQQRDQQLEEAQGLLKLVAQARDLLQQTNQTQKEVHAQRLRELGSQVEQSNARSAQLAQEAEALRTQAAHAAALELENRTLLARLQAAQAAAREAEAAAQLAADAAARQVEAQASVAKKEAELREGLKKATTELSTFKSRSEEAERQRAAKELALMQAQAALECQRREKRTAEAAAVTLSVLVVSVGAAMLMWRSLGSTA